MSGVVQVRAASIAALGAVCLQETWHYHPRTSAEQAKSGIFVAKEHVRPGDLVFAKSSVRGSCSIYIGNDIYVHAPNPDYTVMKTRLSDNSFTMDGTRYVFRGKYVTARRVTP